MNGRHSTPRVRRREFIVFLVGASVAGSWRAPAFARVPTIGFLSAFGKPRTLLLLDPVRAGLNEAGLADGKSVTIEYRAADGQYDRLPALAAELVRRPVSLIIASTPPAAFAAKAATSAIPIVFVVGIDPVASGLVASFNRPGGKLTGVTLMFVELAQKRLQALLEIAPNASSIAMLVNPTSPEAGLETKDVQAAARAKNIAIKSLHASTRGEIDTAFASLANQKPDALIVGSDPFFVSRREQIVALAARLGVPAIYSNREFASSGGLLSYGTNVADAYRQAGVYAGRILKGAKPADLPVLQPTTFEIVLNLKTAKALGIAVPRELLLRVSLLIE
jgi:putative ABC transport system substrate-binding protein